MVRNGTTFNGVVRFMDGRDDYTGQVKLLSGWVNLIERDEYIPSSGVCFVRQKSKQSSMM